MDENQATLVSLLRDAGCTVQCLHDVGRGVPDLLVGVRGVNYLIEVKTPGGRLTTEQVKWHALWRGQVAVVSTIEQALEAVGLSGLLH